nr:hypothetical protein [Tanacetum cinerariifolium]
MRCKELRLTRLCFADNLLMVYHGDVELARIVKDTLMGISEISSLILNMENSTIFFGNVKDEEHNKILYVLPFVVGKLPVKYLGVPLITNKLSSKECKKLINKTAVFLIPKRVVKEIDKVLKGFLCCKGEIKIGLELGT